ncbi:MAG: hypothetical protein M1281_14685 [Chloroflexi bacterium]|nr:hypothetical protein [Chloroflexota bacterium]
MQGGTPVGRHCVVVLIDGNTVVDWGDGLVQDILSGEFFRCREEDISHTVLDAELEDLKHAGHVESYTAQQVYLRALPEPPRSTLD